MSKRGQKTSTNYVKYKNRTREEVVGQTWGQTGAGQTGAGQTGVAVTGQVQEKRAGPRRDKMLQANTVS